MTEPRFFIVGATGLTGRAVVQQALAQEILTTAHIRPDSSSLSRWQTRFSELGASVDLAAWQLESMTEALKTCAPTHVFALLGTTKKRARKARNPDDESYERIDYGLTHLLRLAAEACGSKPRFVYLSAAGVSPGSRNPYMNARARIEAELQSGSLPYTLVRPSFILGNRDEDRLGEKVGAALVNGALQGIGLLGARKMRDRYRSIQAPDLARHLIRVALDSQFDGKIVGADEMRS